MRYITLQPLYDVKTDVLATVYSREHKRFPVLQSAPFSLHGSHDKGYVTLVLALCRVGYNLYHLR